MAYGSFALLDEPYVILPAKKRDQPMLSILPYNKGTRSYDNAVATAVAHVKLPLRQAGNMIIYADRARGPPHDAVVPFRHDPTRRWLRVDALGVEELDDDEDEDDLAYRTCIGLYITYGQILALISQTRVPFAHHHMLSYSSYTQTLFTTDFKTRDGRIFAAFRRRSTHWHM